MTHIVNTMIRTFKGNLKYIDKATFKNDADYYNYLWKTKYNVRFNKNAVEKKVKLALK